MGSSGKDFRGHVFRLFVGLALCLSPVACVQAPKPGEPPKVGWISKARSTVSKILPKPKGRPPKAVKPVLIGTVAMVAEMDRFVLIDMTASSSATPGAEATAISDGRETAKLRISNEKKHPFVIADILVGNPGVGDRVLSNPTLVAPASLP